MLRSAMAETGGIPTIIVPTASGEIRKLETLNGSGKDDSEDDSATYLFELLVAARRLAVTRRHKFLAYLIGMAAEEARLLTQGRSAVRNKVA